MIQKTPHHPSPDAYPGIGRLRHHHQGVQRFAVGPARTDDVAVVSGICERAGQSPVESDLPLVVDLVDVAAVARGFDDYFDQIVHLPRLL
jgi:hypothetical protein